MWDHSCSVSCGGLMTIFSSYSFDSHFILCLYKLCMGVAFFFVCDKVGKIFLDRQEYVMMDIYRAGGIMKNVGCILHFLGLECPLWLI